MAGGVAEPGPPPPEEAPQDAALEGLQQRALSGTQMSEQLELDPGLRSLRGPQLLDVAHFMVVLRDQSQPFTFHQSQSQEKKNTGV